MFFQHKLKYKCNIVEFYHQNCVLIAKNVLLLNSKYTIIFHSFLFKNIDGSSGTPHSSKIGGFVV